MTNIVKEIKQDWDIKINNQRKEVPYLVIDNWYTQEEVNAVWHELDMYATQPIVQKLTTKIALLRRLLRVKQNLMLLDFMYGTITQEKVDLFHQY